MNEPKVLAHGRGWHVIFPADPDVVSIEVQRLVDKSESCWAELTIVSKGGTVRWEPRINLYSAPARKALAKDCEEAVPLGRWGDLLERGTRALHKARNTLPEPQVLTTLPPISREWLVPGWIPAGEITTLFGDGGSGKSLFVLALALAGLKKRMLGDQWQVRALNRVMYLDWESRHEEHSMRLWSLMNASYEGEPVPAIHYHRLRRPLADVWEGLQRQLIKDPCDLVIIDSAMFASSGELDTADSAMGLYNILAEMAPASVIVIGHVTKMTAEQSRGEGRMYGSVQHRNAPRSNIEFRLQDGATPYERTVSCYHRKTNAWGGVQGEAAFTFVSDEQGRTMVRPGQRDHAHSSLSTQILAALKPGPETVTDLSQALDEPEGSVRKTLHRLQNRDMVVAETVTGGGRGNKTLWRLVDRNRDTNGYKP